MTYALFVYLALGVALLVLGEQAQEQAGVQNAISTQPRVIDRLICRLIVVTLWAPILVLIAVMRSRD